VGGAGGAANSGTTTRPGLVFNLAMKAQKARFLFRQVSAAWRIISDYTGADAAISGEHEDAAGPSDRPRAKRRTFLQK